MACARNKTITIYDYARPETTFFYFARNAKLRSSWP